MPLKDVFQLFQVGDGMGGRNPYFGSGMVDEDAVHPGIDGALDIGIGVVADHDAFLKPCSRPVESELEDFLFGLEAVAGFGGDDMTEKMGDTAVGDFRLLGKFKAVGDDVQPVILLRQILQDFEGVREQLLFFGQLLQEAFAHISGKQLISHFEIEQGAPHPFPFEFFGSDESFVVAVPHDFVVLLVGAVEMIEVGYAPLTQFELPVDFFQGVFRVAVKIPQGMIEVEKKMFVFHRRKPESSPVFVFLCAKLRGMGELSFKTGDL